MRIAVIGVGGTGSAALRHLAKAGHSVTGFEQFVVGHDRGSSHGESRIIRYTYPDLLYTQMMGDAYPLWAELEEEAEESLFVRCGGVYFGKDTDKNVHITEQSLREVGLPYDRLNAKEAEDRFSAFRFAEDEVILYQPESGFLRASRVVRANARLALEAGATLRENSTVATIRQVGAEVIIQTADGAEEAFDRAIVTAGAWVSTLFPQLRMPLVVTRQQVIYLTVGQNEAYFQQGSLPVWIDSTTNFYGFPDDGILSGAKIASHNHGNAVDPNAVRREVDASYYESVCAYASTRMPDLTTEVTYRSVCLYTNTPDEDFILDTVPDMPHILLVSACSGHGFKFTALMGKIAAELATGGGYAHSLARFALSRFV
jgi:monomeric sarcosine oxidase